MSDKSRVTGRGLKQLGNTCYFNSTLQCLAKTKPLRKALRSLVDQNEVSSTSTSTLSNDISYSDKDVKLTNKGLKGAPLTNELRNAMKAISINTSNNNTPLVSITPSYEADNIKQKTTISKKKHNSKSGSSSKSANNAFDPSSLLTQLRKCAPQFKGKEQQDAHECLLSILSECHDELVQQKKKAIFKNKKESQHRISNNQKKCLESEDGEEESSGEEEGEEEGEDDDITSVISDTFGLTLWNIIKCNVCQYEFMNEEDTMILSLNIPGMNNQSATNDKRNKSSYKNRFLINKNNGGVTKKSKKLQEKTALKMKKKKEAELALLAESEWLESLNNGSKSNKGNKNKSSKKLKQEEKSMKRLKKLATRKGVSVESLTSNNETKVEIDKSVIGSKNISTITNCSTVQEEAKKLDVSSDQSRKQKVGDNILDDHDGNKLLNDGNIKVEDNYLDNVTNCIETDVIEENGMEVLSVKGNKVLPDNETTTNIPPPILSTEKQMNNATDISMASIRFFLDDVINDVSLATSTSTSTSTETSTSTDLTDNLSSEIPLPSSPCVRYKTLDATPVKPDDVTESNLIMDPKLTEPSALKTCIDVATDTTTIENIKQPSEMMNSIIEPNSQLLDSDAINVEINKLIDDGWLVLDEDEKIRRNKLIQTMERKKENLDIATTLKNNDGTTICESKTDSNVVSKRESGNNGKLTLNACLNDFIEIDQMEASKGNGIYCPCCEAKLQRSKYMNSKEGKISTKMNEDIHHLDKLKSNNECYSDSECQSDDGAEDSDSEVYNVKHSTDNYHHVENERLSGMVDGTHRIMIAKAPKVLLLHLKRLLPHGKLEHHVQAPDTINLSPYCLASNEDIKSGGDNGGNSSSGDECKGNKSIGCFVEGKNSKIGGKENSDDLYEVKYDKHNIINVSHEILPTTEDIDPSSFDSVETSKLIQKTVSLPITTHQGDKSSSSLIYDLFAFVEHIGGSRAGHYVAYTQTNMDENPSSSDSGNMEGNENNGENGEGLGTCVKKWNRISDASVDDESEVVSDAKVYILFYARRG